MKKVTLIKPGGVRFWLRCALGVFNLMLFCFVLAYTFLQQPSVASNVFGIMILVSYVCNMLFATAIKDRKGMAYLILFAVSILLIFGLNLLATMNIFKSSLSVVSILLALLIHAAAVVLALFDFGKDVAAQKQRRWYGGLKGLMTVIIPIVVVIFAVLAYDFMNNTGYSVGEYLYSAMAIPFAFFALALMFMLIRVLVIEKEGGFFANLRKSFSMVVLTVIMGIFAFVGFNSQLFAVPQDIDNAEYAYQQAFGETVPEGMRSVVFSVPDLLLGTKTTGYQVMKDVLYYEGAAPSGRNAGIKLSYDVYYPDFETDNRAVIIRMHGSGGDKDSGNYGGPNKYFASRGFVVYDIQYGDFNEKQTPAMQKDFLHQGDAVFFISKMIEHAMANNDVTKGDFDSLFISGNSLGGYYAMQMALQMTHEDGLYKNLGATVKGIIPIYPGSQPTAEDDVNFLNLIDANSPPCLMFMGTHDGVVLKEITWYTQMKYQSFGIPYAAILLSYATHGGDSYFTGPASQIFTHYWERFMLDVK